MTLSIKVVHQFKMAHTKDKRMESMAKASKTLKKVMMDRAGKVREKMNVHGQSRANMTGVVHGLVQRGEVLE